MKNLIYISFKQLKVHKITSIFLLIGFLISILLISIGISSIEQEKNMILQSSEGFSKNTIILNVSGRNSDIFKSFYEINKDLKLENRISFKNLSCYIEGSSELINSITAEQFNNEWKYPLKSGRYFSKENILNGDKVVLVSENYEDLIKEGYLNIDDEEYEVIGIIGNNFEDKIVMPINSLPQKVISDEDYSPKEIYIDNFEMYPTDIVQKLKSKFELDNINVSYGDNSSLKNNVRLDLKSNPILFSSLLIYLISIINMINLSFYWVNDKRKEIAIRKSFGISNKNISKLIITEFIELTLITTIIALIVQLILSLLLENLIKIPLSLTINNFIVAIAISIFSGVITAIIPIIKSIKVQPIEALKL